MPDPYIPLPSGLKAFRVTAVCATVAAWLVVLAAQLLGLGFPYNWPIAKYMPRFDFYDYFSSFRLLHRASFFSAPGYPFTYMPSGVFLYQAFYLFGVRKGFITYLLFVLLSVCFAIVRLRGALLRRGLRPSSVNLLMCVLLFGSYPIAFCLQRGNLEIILAIFIGFGAWAYWSGRTWTAALLWGICGSVKIYPLLLLALFLSVRQYRQLLVSLGSAAVATLAALLYIGPSLRVAVSGIRSSLSAFLGLYALRYDWGSIGFDHSLFALLKLLLRPLHLPLTGLLHVYMPFAGLVGVLLYFIRVRKLPLANQFLFLTTLSILIPPTSFDYTLVQLYSPFAVLLFAAIDDRSIRITPMFVTLGLLFTPTNFLFLHGEGFAGQIKAILLTALVCFTVQRPASRREPVMDNELRLIGQETS